VQVDPELASDVVLHTGVLLVVKSVQGAADHRVHLDGKEDKRMKRLQADARSTHVTLQEIAERVGAITEFSCFLLLSLRENAR